MGILGRVNEVVSCYADEKIKPARVVLTVNDAPILDVDLYTLIAVTQAAGNRIHGSGAVDLSHPAVRLEVDGVEVKKPEWMFDDDACESCPRR